MKMTCSRQLSDLGHAMIVMARDQLLRASSYFTLHDDNGWSYERAERWLADQAIAALLT
jgi:hypothetical protein